MSSSGSSCNLKAKLFRMLTRAGAKPKSFIVTVRPGETAFTMATQLSSEPKDLYIHD